jgi:hypothetical protein
MRRNLHFKGRGPMVETKSIKELLDKNIKGSEP